MERNKFSQSWKSSKKPAKQRNYARNAPLHIKSGMLSARLSRELHGKYRKRSCRVRKGDTVLVLRGQFRKKSGKVERVDTRHSRVFITGIERQRKDGTKSMYPIPASNVLITGLYSEDRKRMKIFERKVQKNG